MSLEVKRSLQHVVAVSDCVKCVEWMVATAALDGEKGLPSKTVDAFPAYFRSHDRRVNLNKARDWWRKREALLNPEEDSVHEIYNKLFKFNSKCFIRLVTPRRIQDFTDRHNIVYRRLKGKKQVSSEKLREIHILVAAHLGSLNRQFDDGLINPDFQYNMDESHFVIDLDDGKTLDFRGVAQVKNRSVVSGREGTTMCVLLRGGSNARVECPMLIFKNKKGQLPYPGTAICNTGGGVPDVANSFHQQQPNAGVAVRSALLGARRAVCQDTHAVDRQCESSQRGEVVAAAKKLRTGVKLFPANVTDLVQP
ncbi:hypothetical protein PF002_g17771 [Phytophthora fragariae]|uniref:DDE-1 domain-containing protein n=1 Tax=Phytophthora fragariae TaxID=53985 RepID=A0A6A3EJS6_9STRA|nr:hypothetical protein PF009_g16244 [Phytophthora fragariae]KAE9132223.1 hypothetical protein PF006_g15326 [Phytophthora fragariae]KAE9214089.1 hypothetical protein PF002_g17771 [Phytophthora fragariae]KAE9298981.1 hypothetical protein PF001_g15669 [Phytophthora fragariae]